MYQITVKNNSDYIIEFFNYKSSYFAVIKLSKIIDKYTFKNISENNSYEICFRYLNDSKKIIISNITINS